MTNTSNHRLRASDIFSPSLFWQGIKRLRLVGILALLTVSVPTLLSILYNFTDTVPVNRQHTFSSLTNFIGIAMAIYGVVSVITVFSFLNSRSQCDFYHALPQSRACLFNSFYLAAITVTVGVTLLSYGTVLLTMSHAASITFNAGLGLTVRIILNVLWAMSIIAFAKAITGTAFLNFLAFIIPTVSIAGSAFILTTYLMTVTPILSVSPFLTTLQSSFLTLSVGIFNIAVDNKATLPVTLVYALIITLFNVGASIAFKRRFSQIAGKPTIRPSVTHTLACLLIAPMILGSIYLMVIWPVIILFAFTLIALPVIVFFAAEAIGFRSFIKAFKAFPIFLLTVVICISSVAGAHLTGFAAELTVPSADQLSGVAIIHNYGQSLSEYELVLEDEDDIELFTSNLKEYAQLPFNEDSATQRVTAAFIYKNGGVAIRSFKISEEHYVDFINTRVARFYLSLMKHSQSPDNHIQQGQYLSDEVTQLRVVCLTSIYRPNDPDRKKYLNIGNKEYLETLIYEELSELSTEEIIYLSKMPLSADGEPYEYAAEFHFTVYSEDNSAEHVYFNLPLDKEMLPESYKLVNDFVTGTAK